jgi:hypothetical protein
MSTQADPLDCLRRAKPILICGVPRSGTTLIRALIGSHPNLAIPDREMGWWTLLYPVHRWANTPRAWQRFREALFEFPTTQTLGLDLSAIRQQANAIPLGCHAQAFGLLLSAYAVQNGKPRWGEKTPLAEFYAHKMLEAFPHARVIHMIRDPRDVCASRRRVPWPHLRNRNPYKRAAQRILASIAWIAYSWRRSAQIAERHRTRHPERYFVLRYEDLVADPVERLKHVCDFLGEHYDARMLEMGAYPEFRERGGNSSFDQWEHISTASVGRHLSSLTPRQIRLCEWIAGAELRRQGYEPSRARLAARDLALLAAQALPTTGGTIAIWQIAYAFDGRPRA